MKLLPIVFTLFVLIKANECTQNWFPQNLVQTIAKETSLIKDYVQEKGRSLKNFYINNVQNKISSYFGMLHGDANSQEDHIKQARIKRKFKDYLEDAQAKDNVIFDSIAPKIDRYPCSNDDPTIHMTTPQLIALHGYYSESHTIVTDDGYILTLHRIPHSKNTTGANAYRKTVLLHHGLLGSSADWVISGPKKALAYILSNAGYDVWLANVRGNTYSRAHISINPDTFAFWNFTFHDVSQHDIPAIIDYIMENKGWDIKINYIGHSMGTTILFALLSTKTQYNKVLRAGYALAPVAFMTNIRSPIRLLARFSDNIAYLMKLLGANEFLPQNAVLRWLSKHACEINHYEEAICENSMFVLCGHDEKQFNKTLLPLILGHVPAGASTKSLIHYAQEIRNDGRFQQFDYGPDGNYRMYGSPIPPEYPLYKITLPIALISSDNDWLASEEDVNNLYTRLANPLEHYIVPYKDFNHLDFLWAIDAPKLVYNKLLQLLEDGVNKYSVNFQNSNEIN
ncbi:gastric triacylglycerol lipase-like [Battus philenor]|uniref:gastric triacylglycerol lipase-like n=1 Tax=Battus philenor TaxID=42288 RepID=UPI0035CFA075